MEPFLSNIHYTQCLRAALRIADMLNKYQPFMRRLTPSFPSFYSFYGVSARQMYRLSRQSYSKQPLQLNQTIIKCSTYTNQMHVCIPLICYFPKTDMDFQSFINNKYTGVFKCTSIKKESYSPYLLCKCTFMFPITGEELQCVLEI